MLSIVICSQSPTVSSTFAENIAKTIGIPFELVVIDNSKNKFSLTQAYNLGIERSRFPYLCFVHQDVIFRSCNWGKHIVTHLTDEDTGIIGVAGSSFISKVPASWSFSHSHFNLIQSSKNPHSKPQEMRCKSKQEVIVLDGVFLCMRKNITDVIFFSENLEGFHGYDFDISLKSIGYGYKNYVVNDILPEHFSIGKKNKTYYINLLKIFELWENALPIQCEKEIAKDWLKRTDTRKLTQLLLRMSRRGFSLKQLLNTLSQYEKSAALSFSPLKRLSIFIQVTVTRLIFNKFLRRILKR